MAIDEAHRRAVLDFLTAREEQRRDATAELLARARQDFARIVALIVERYQPREVWQWGSLLYPQTFGKDSDIDIGLLGVAVQDHMAIQRETEGTAYLPLHIARVGKMGPRTRDLIYSWGRRVFPPG